MKRRTLQQLIEQARRRRDDTAMHAARAHREVDGAQRTLDTLANYRDEQLRDPGTRTGVDAGMLRLRERFNQKLHGAIDEQTRVRDALHEAAERRRDELIGRQRRLLALETLQARRDAANTKRRARAEQRDTDEHAAQVARRRRDGGER